MLKKMTQAIKLTNSYITNKAEIDVINTFLDKINSMVLYNMFSDESLDMIDEYIYGPGQDIILDYLLKVGLAITMDAEIDIEDIKEIIDEVRNKLFRYSSINEVLSNAKDIDNAYYIIFILAYLNIKIYKGE